MSGFFSKLFGGGKAAPSAAPKGEVEVYNGYEIEPRPKAQGGQFNIAGVIRKQGEPDGPAHEFIRADTFSDAGEAARYTIIKAKQIIDQKGERMFADGGGW